MPAPAHTIGAARAELAAGRVAEADAACLALLRGDPADVAAMHLLALIRARAGRLEEGAGLLDRVVQLAPDSLAARNDLSAMLITLGRPEAAEATLRAGLARSAADESPATVEALVNLGNALHAQGRLDAAEAEYRAALAADPRHIRGLISLGNLLAALRRPAEAREPLAAAATLAPGSAAAHLFLANALRDLGHADEAVASYQRALAIEPAHADSNENLGGLHKSRGRLEEALRYFRASANPFARAQALDCELRLGRHRDFFAWLEAHVAEEAANLHSASLSAYAAAQLGRTDPHRYCPDPLSMVRIVDRYTTAADAPFLADLVREASQVDALWEPRGVTTKRGFQTGGNLFVHAAANPGGALARLRDDLIAELQRYRAALPATGLGLAERWPAAPRLHGWYVRLLTGGHQGFHNHPFGWLSGCLYLRMPEAAPAGEGAIEFGLAGDDFPKLADRPAPTLLHQPRPGQLALFPSSLFHRTIPFRSDEERLCIAFDLLPR